MTPDFNSPTWVFLVDHISTRVAKLRKDNDSLGLDAVATASLRGQILALVQLAELPEQLRRDQSFREQPSRLSPGGEY